MPKTLPIVFLLIAFAIIAFVLANYSPVKVDILGIGSNRSTQTTTSYPTPYTGLRPDTVIISGPADWETIMDSSVVVFQFVGIWSGSERLYFETKVDEIDSDWVPVYGNSRIIQLLPGKHTYHFAVRAKTINGIEDQSPAYRTFVAELSNKAGQVKIISVNPHSSPQKMVLINKSGSSVDLTGWKIENNFRSFDIPAAVKIFRLSSSTAWQNIILQPDDSLIVLSSASPITVNFYLNRCFGYLMNSYNFSNLFSKDCPRPNDDDLNYLSTQCQRYINDLRTCQIPSTEDLNRFANDFTCYQFLTNFYNYESCVNRYQNASDFFEKEWYVFLNASFADTNHDKIILRDADGLVVDTYLY